MAEFCTCLHCKLRWRPNSRPICPPVSMPSTLKTPSCAACYRPCVSRPFFRLYSVDILASCEYMPQELFECYSESCEIYPVDDDEVGYMLDVYLSLHHLQQRGSLCPHVLFIFQQVDMVRVCNLITNPHTPLPSTLYHTHRQQVPEQLKSVDFRRVRL